MNSIERGKEFILQKSYMAYSKWIHSVEINLFNKSNPSQLFQGLFLFKLKFSLYVNIQFCSRGELAQLVASLFLGSEIRV